MNPCSVGYLTDRPGGNPRKNVRCSLIISSLKIPDCYSEILERCFALYVLSTLNNHGRRLPGPYPPPHLGTPLRVSWNYSSARRGGLPTPCGEPGLLLSGSSNHKPSNQLPN